MAAGFTEWTVLPHDPIQKHSERVWTVTGTMPDGSTTRTMTCAKLADGRLVIHNAVALSDGDMLDLEAWGTPGILLVPNGFHRQDAKIWKDRFRDMKVYCPTPSMGRVAKAVALDGSYGDARLDDPDVTLEYIPGTKEREGSLTIVDDTGRTVVFVDMLTNVPKQGGLAGLAFAPTGILSMPRVSRFLVRPDNAVFRKHLESLADHADLVRIVPGHGRVVKESARAAVKRAASLV